MTKNVRIENADTSSFKVRVRVEHKDAEGNWAPAMTSKLVVVDGETRHEQVPLVHTIDYPTSMLQEYLTSHRRFIVEEYE